MLLENAFMNQIIPVLIGMALVIVSVRHLIIAVSFRRFIDDMNDRFDQQQTLTGPGIYGDFAVGLVGLLALAFYPPGKDYLITLFASLFVFFAVLSLWRRKSPPDDRISNHPVLTGNLSRLTHTAIGIVFLFAGVRYLGELLQVKTLGVLP